MNLARVVHQECALSHPGIPMTTINRNGSTIIQSSVSTSVNGKTTTQSSEWTGKKWVQGDQKGKATDWVKQQLVQGGYLTADQAKTPKFDLTALNALKKFQQANGLKDDGIAGPKTFAKLNAAARQYDTFQQSSVKVGTPGSTSVADAGKLATSDVASPQKLQELASQADKLGNGDGQVTSAELQTLRDSKLKELQTAASSGDIGKAIAAGTDAGLASQVAFQQDRKNDITSALQEAIDTSTTGNSDGNVSRAEIEAYVAKQKASGDPQKAAYAAMAQDLLKDLPVQANSLAGASKVSDGGSTAIANTSKLKLDNPVSAAKMAELAKAADGNNDGRVSAAEWKTLSEAKLAELMKGDVNTAAAAGADAGTAAQAAFAQSGVDDTNRALKEAIDTSKGIGDGDGNVTAKEINAYIAKQEASGDAQKKQYADMARDLLKQVPIRG
jgi:hypothetical protein